MSNFVVSEKILIDILKDTHSTPCEEIRKRGLVLLPLVRDLCEDYGYCKQPSCWPDLSAQDIIDKLLDKGFSLGPVHRPPRLHPTYTEVFYE